MQIIIFKNFYFHCFFREREEGRVGNINVREKHWCERETSIGYPHPCPDQRLNLQPRRVPWPEIEPTNFWCTGRGVQPFGVSGTHWKKSCLGPHIKYIVTHNHIQKSHNVLSKFMNMCWAAFIAILSHTRPVGHRLDTPGGWRSRQLSHLAMASNFVIFK